MGRVRAEHQQGGEAGVGARGRSRVTSLESLELRPELTQEARLGGLTVNVRTQAGGGGGGCDRGQCGAGGGRGLGGG